MKTLRDYINLIENAQAATSEGIFDRFKKSPTTRRNGVDLEAFGSNGEYQINAYINDTQVGQVLFDIDGRTLVAKDLQVFPKYRGKGISKIMYDWAKDLGYTVKRSPEQTDAGKHFWDKNRNAEQVWEASPDAIARIEQLASDK